MTNQQSNQQSNQQWLATLKPDEWWNVVDWLYHDYGKRWTDSRPAIIDWLAEEHKPIVDDDGTVRWQ